MTLDPKEAAASLGDIEAVERRTRETLFYFGNSPVLILWGVLYVAGYLLTWFRPQLSLYGWLIVDLIGVAGTYAVVWPRISPAQRRAHGWRWAGTFIALFVFGEILMVEMWPVTTRSVLVFWPTLVMFGYVLAGIWLGRFYIYFGVVEVALILLGYFLAGAWLAPWMAVAVGGGFLAGGLWLRRLA
jgi:hypothetical protein